MGKAWGFHLMLNVGKCRPDTIRCAQNIERFTKQLVKDIDMKAFGEPQIVMFGEGDKKGYTLVQLIETSNICAHFCEESNDFYLDVFSCKPFDNNDVKACVHKFFEPTSMNEHYVQRLA
jgi:S-adenosylmethionine/arginine decarboxylase-like enzyme